ncbi:vezatin [Strongylocentrotus purpuratus]|uniref:Vezatin n=1 Tax=Strongylocentrotus purpuratus TaxID=7668 RepID=A0A7M7NNG7_STRPU|nr:vezatin [Strongylocentrotus purpuratus]
MKYAMGNDFSFALVFLTLSYLLQIWTTRITHGSLFPVDRKEFLAYLNNHGLPKYYTLALISKCVNEEDATVLSTLLGVSETTSKLSGTKISLWLFILGLLMFSHIMLLCGVCHPTLLWDAVDAFNIPNILMYTVVMTTLFLSLLWQVGVVWQYFRLWRENRHQEQSVSQFLSVHKSFGNLLKKSVLYVQEVEVILRGYTMMTPFTPISHLERGSQTQLQCPALRQAIFQAARNQFMSLRQAMLSTIADSPLRDEEQRDLEDVYLATTDLQHLAGELSILTDDSTGPYPTSYLKAISNLYSDQLSEFIRRHLLCLKSDLLADSADATSSSHSLLDAKRRLAEQDLTTLKSSYKLHQPMTPLQSDVDPEVKMRGTEEIWGPSDVLPSATRALRLHLDVTMKSAMQLEMGTRKEDGKSDLGDSEIHDLEELLSEVKGHLEACQTCVHEAETALAKLTGRVEPAKLKEPVMSKTETGQLKADIPTPQHLDFISPKDSDIDFIEEEVFEAYIDPEKDDNIPDYSMEDLIEERRKKKQDSEDAKHMLMELNSVLTKREGEKEKMRRERRRMKDGGDLVKETETLGELNEGAVDSTNDDRTIGDRKTNIPVTCNGSLSELESGNTSTLCDSLTDLDHDQTLSQKCHEHHDRHIGKVNPQQLSHDINCTEDSSSETKLLEVADNGDDEKYDDQKSDDRVLRHQMSLNGCQDVSSSGSGEGYDASGIGRSTETMIRRPVPKPRKNIGKRLNPSSDGNVAPLGSDSIAASHESGQASLVRSDQDYCDPEEKKSLDSEGHGSESGDREGVCQWRQQPMDIPFMQGLAAEAVRISRERQSLAEDTFGD